MTGGVGEPEAFRAVGKGRGHSDPMRIRQLGWLALWWAGLGAGFTPLTHAGAIIPGFNDHTLGPGDDQSSGPLVIGFDVNFFGTTYSELFINNNGNVSFNQALASYSAGPLSSLGQALIAPFFADVDTRGVGSDATTWGVGLLDGRATFAVNWGQQSGVGYFNAATDRLNKFQLLLVDRSDIAIGDFDIYFNYDQIQWESGDVSLGYHGRDGDPARIGFAAGDPNLAYELDGSGQNGVILDGGSRSLSGHGNAGKAGSYLFQMRDGAVVSVPEASGSLGLLALGLLGLGWFAWGCAPSPERRSIPLPAPPSRSRPVR